jgi:hypothetical protein
MTALDPTYGSPTLDFISGSYQGGIRQSGDTLVMASNGLMSLSSTGLLNIIATAMTFISTGAMTLSSAGSMSAISSSGSVTDIPSAINSKADIFIGLTDAIDPSTVSTLIFNNGILVAAV